MTAKTRVGRKPRRARRRAGRKSRLSAPGRRLATALREVLADVTGRTPLPVVVAAPAIVDVRAGVKAGEG